MTATAEDTESARLRTLAAFLELTVSDLYRAEFIGEAIIVSPPPDGAYHRSVGALTRSVARESATDHYTSCTKGLITPMGHVIPDVTIAPIGSFQGLPPWADTSVITMTAEVTTAYRARGGDTRRHGYAAAGIPFYLLIDHTEGGSVTLHGEPKEQDYREITQVPFGAPLHLPEPFSFTLDTSGFS